MGTGQSIPSTLTRQKVFDLTRDTRGMMDVILEYMLKEISVRDFLALSNPTECKKYVIFLANNLYRHFYELQISPIKGKSGVIAFRPVKDLIKDDDTEKQSLCLTLAYFYTRIFQIYGALALTLIDDANVISDTGMTTLPIDTIKRGLVTPGYSTYTTRGGAAPGASQLNDFIFLHTFLDDMDETAQTIQGYQTLYEGEDDEVRFKPSPVEGGKQKGIFYIGIKDASYNEYNKLFVSTSLKDDKRGGDRICTIGELLYYKKNKTYETIKLSSTIVPVKTITIKEIKQIRSRQRKQFVIINPDGTPSDKSISDYFNEVISNVIKFIKDNNVSNTITSTSGVIISETGTTDELKLARIVQNLTKTKPLGHCLARAMQLLRTLPLKGQDAVSHICKAKFLEYTTSSVSGTKTQISRSGIPEPGKPLSDSPGLAALSQLFYDTVMFGTPKITIGTKAGPSPDKKSSLELYVDFMRKMSNLFEGSESKLDIDYSKKTLENIINKRDKAMCSDISENLRIPSNNVGNVYQYVSKLYKIQIKHAADCGKIITLLFNMTRDKSSGRYTFSLNDNIIKKGFPEIERINFIARDLLVRYYSNCETTYMMGAAFVRNLTHTPLTTANPIPGTASTRM